MPAKLKRFAPPQLVALIVGTAISLTVFGAADIRRIGEIPTGLPTLQMPTFTAAQFTIMIVDGIMLGMLGCIDTLLTAVIADSLTRTEHKSDKELIGQGIALKVGVDILDWSFLKRSHKVSLRGSIIMYGVLLLTVFVDLIVAVGVGVFIANILTIERLSELHSEEVKTISDADDDIVLNDEEKQLIEQADGRVLLFYLSGPMIFGVSKAIAREHAAMRDADVLIVDLSDVPMMGVTASLAIENAIKDAVDQNRQVFIVGAAGKVKQPLEKFGIMDFVRADRFLDDRTEALRQAVDLVKYNRVQANGTATKGFPTEPSDATVRS
ncbi:sulfate permease family protein [Microseira wollei NIES-4236]|uniref:Sulfate permease family protein n=1 Tax=Microseira wollei NIES-4236 TaxID=2530354 RepID=A0AAV3XLI6_9CYAN|nr:sulfate permease family protein [Microseira wollei NIES-4236]